MNQTVPVTVKCKRCNGRIVQGAEPYCLSCGHRPEGFRISASDAGPLVMWNQRKMKNRAECVNGHELTADNRVISTGGRVVCRQCKNAANRLWNLRASKSGVA